MCGLLEACLARADWSIGRGICLFGGHGYTKGMTTINQKHTFRSGPASWTGSMRWHKVRAWQTTFYLYSRTGSNIVFAVAKKSARGFSFVWVWGAGTLFKRRLSCFTFSPDVHVPFPLYLCDMSVHACVRATRERAFFLKKDTSTALQLSLQSHLLRLETAVYSSAVPETIPA